MITEEEATIILEKATDAETKASVSLAFLIYFIILKHVPNADEIPIQLKALSIETVRKIAEIKKEA